MKVLLCQIILLGVSQAANLMTKEEADFVENDDTQLELEERQADTAVIPIDPIPIDPIPIDPIDPIPLPHCLSRETLCAKLGGVCYAFWLEASVNCVYCKNLCGSSGCVCCFELQVLQ